MVECQLPKLDVAGSTPVTRSKSFRHTGSRPRRFLCPKCGREFERAASPYVPFCSRRCKLVDLGKWLDEEYRIPGEPSRGAGESPDNEEDL